MRAHHAARLVGWEFVGEAVRRDERQVVEAKVWAEGERLEEGDARV